MVSCYRLFNITNQGDFYSPSMPFLCNSTSVFNRSECKIVQEEKTTREATAPLFISAEHMETRFHDGFHGNLALTEASWLGGDNGRWGGGDKLPSLLLCDIEWPPNLHWGGAPTSPTLVWHQSWRSYSIRDSYSTRQAGHFPILATLLIPTSGLA